jgi:hypothetical protein
MEAFRKGQDVSDKLLLALVVAAFFFHFLILFVILVCGISSLYRGITEYGNLWAVGFGICAGVFTIFFTSQVISAIPNNWIAITELVAFSCIYSGIGKLIVRKVHHSL